MKKLLLSILTIALTLTIFGTAVMAASEAIEKKTFDLKADTILVQEIGIAGKVSETSTVKKDVESHTIKYIDPQAAELVKMYPFTHHTKLGTNAILKVDISSIKYASDFSLKFSFITGDEKNNCVKVYCADYEDGVNLISNLTPGSTKSVVDRPTICREDSDKVVYEYQKTTDRVDNVDVELSVNDSSAINPKMYGATLESHINDAIKNGEDSVYFLVKGVIISNGNQWTDSGSYCMVYNSASSTKAPALTVTGSTISSEIAKTEIGYTYTVGNLKNYIDNAIVVVAAYDAKDSLIKIAASGEVAVTEDGVDVDIACADAAYFKAYIWKAGTLEPVTYIETISL